ARLGPFSDNAAAAAAAAYDMPTLVRAKRAVSAGTVPAATAFNRAATTNTPTSALYVPTPPHCSLTPFRRPLPLSHLYLSSCPTNMGPMQPPLPTQGLPHVCSRRAHLILEVLAMGLPRLAAPEPPARLAAVCRPSSLAPTWTSPTAVGTCGGFFVMHTCCCAFEHTSHTI
ncbi:hypothetical protein FRC08_018876, partial [Ceratobasidium sp. 394]